MKNTIFLLWRKITNTHVGCRCGKWLHFIGEEHRCSSNNISIGDLSTLFSNKETQKKYKQYIDHSVINTKTGEIKGHIIYSLSEK